MEPQEPITLISLAGGAAVERFDIELEKVLKNIADVNTEAKVKREISLKVTFVPDEEREIGVVQVAVTSRLPGLKSVTTRVFFGRMGGKPVAVESNPKQIGLFGPPQSNVVPMGATVQPSAPKGE